MKKLLNNLAIFAIEIAFITCKPCNIKNNINKNNIEQNVYSIIDTNTVYKKVSVEFTNITGQFNCEYLQFKSNYKFEIYPCDHLKSIKNKKKNENEFYIDDSGKIVIKNMVNSWHGKQKNIDTLYIQGDSLIKVNRYQGGSVKKEVFKKYR